MPDYDSGRDESNEDGKADEEDEDIETEEEEEETNAMLPLGQADTTKCQRNVQ